VKTLRPIATSFIFPLCFRVPLCFPQMCNGHPVSYHHMGSGGGGQSGDGAACCFSVVGLGGLVCLIIFIITSAIPEDRFSSAWIESFVGLSFVCVFYAILLSIAYCCPSCPTSCPNACLNWCCTFKCQLCGFGIDCASKEPMSAPGGYQSCDAIV
jgi:hypothetical protein